MESEYKFWSYTIYTPDVMIIPENSVLPEINPSHILRTIIITSGIYCMNPKFFTGVLERPVLCNDLEKLFHRAQKIKQLKSEL